MSEVKLITFDRNRITNWLIDRDLYLETLILPDFKKPNSFERLGKRYVETYFNLINSFISKNKIKLLIGAQDENTVYALIKKLSNPDRYWSIEDGLANYYHRDYLFKSTIFLKKLLFLSYGWNLDIAYEHGEIEKDKSFRMEPSMCVNSGTHTNLGTILNQYISNSFPKEIIKNVGNKEVLVVSRINKYEYENINRNNDYLYKFHPNDKIIKNLNIDYVNKTIPIEILVSQMKNLKRVRFDVLSTSLLNILVMFDSVKVEIAFPFQNQIWTPFFLKLKKKYSSRIKLIK